MFESDVILFVRAVGWLCSGAISKVARNCGFRWTTEGHATCWDVEVLWNVSSARVPLFKDKPKDENAFHLRYTFEIVFKNRFRISYTCMSMYNHIELFVGTYLERNSVWYTPRKHLKHIWCVLGEGVCRCLGPGREGVPKLDWPGDLKSKQIWNTLQILNVTLLGICS